MPPAPLAPHLRALAPDFARRFALIAAGLIAVIARAFLRDPRLIPLIVPLYRRLTRAAARCTALMALLAAGRRPRRAAQRSGDESDRGRPSRPRKRPHALKIPTTQAWLVHTLRHEAAAYASQLAHLLADPAVPELLAAAPTTVHFLRPICRILGVNVPLIPPCVSVSPQTSPAVSPTGHARPQPPPRPTPRAPPPSRAFADDLPWITDPFFKPA